MSLKLFETIYAFFAWIYHFIIKLAKSSSTCFFKLDAVHVTNESPHFMSQSQDMVTGLSLNIHTTTYITVYIYRFLNIKNCMTHFIVYIVYIFPLKFSLKLPRAGKMACSSSQFYCFGNFCQDLIQFFLIHFNEGHRLNICMRSIKYVNKQNKISFK